MAKKNVNELKTAEAAAMKESEAQLEAGNTEQNVDETTIDAALVEAGADADGVTPAEAAAVHTDTETALEASESTSAKRTTKKSAPVKKEAKRSTAYQAAAAKHDGEALSLTDAIDRAKTASYGKFDGTIELHARLLMKKGSTTDSIRAVLQLPSGAPRQVNAVVLTDALIDEIVATKRAPADMYLATPAMMPKVAKVAKILGPQGKMPNPKTGTVTDDTAAALKEIQSGRVEYRADAQGIVHLGIGKATWTTDKLVANAMAVLSTIGFNRLRTVSVASTMGVGIAVDLTQLA